MKNKGFSLVELIIVIAIMAILAAAIAPALIRYIDKSRRADDVAAAESINTAAQAALSNEDAYDDIQDIMPTNGDATTASIVASAQAGQGKFSAAGSAASDAAIKNFLAEVNSSTGDKSPKLKYTKNDAAYWTIGVNGAGKPVVWLGTSSADTKWEMQPTICPSYK